MTEFHENVEIYSADIPGDPGDPASVDTPGKMTITFYNKGDITVYDEQRHHSFSLHGKVFGGNTTGIWIGASKAEGAKAGYIALRNTVGNDSIVINGAKGDITLYDENNHHSMSLHGNVDGYTGLWIGASKAEGAKAGKLFLRDSAGNDSITLDGSSGDILLSNADCAEDFIISDPQNAEPGTVMVLGQEGILHSSTIEYDKKVAGVISGAGDKRAGIILDKKPSQLNRKPIALMGKVNCKVDANFSPINVGDLLTTSRTPGHAMKVEDPTRAFGAIIGKALACLSKGTGIIPVLISSQ